MNTIEQSKANNVRINGTNHFMIITQQIGSLRDSAFVNIEKGKSLPFILAFIEESGIDKRELIQKLVTEDDAGWVLELSYWLDVNGCNHKNWIDSRTMGEIAQSHCEVCGVSKTRLNHLQSKFGDKEGEEK